MPAGIITAGIVGGSDGPDHVLAGGLPPKGTHALARMATPALDEGMGSEDGAVDLLKLGFVQAGLGAAVDFIAVVEHEAGAVGVAEVFEVGNLDGVTGLSGVQVVDQLLGGVEEDELGVVFLLYGLDFRNQILLFLTGSPTDIGWPVDQPGNGSLVASALSKFPEADARGPDEIGPPVIVRMFFELLPFDEGRPARDHDVFLLDRLLDSLSMQDSGVEQGEKKEKIKTKAVHRVLHEAKGRR